MGILNFEKIPLPHEVMSHVKNNGYLICNNAIDEKTISELQNFWIYKFTNLKKNILKKYFRSFVFRLGDENFWAFSNKKNDYRVKRQEFLWNEMDDNTRNLLVEMHKFTNKCLDQDENSGLFYSNNKNVLTLSVNYYPPNDGFLAEHRDASDKKMLLWMIFNLTGKGDHFDEGGLYIINHKGKKINLDEISEPGSILFFNGTLKHGVDKIISKKNIGKISVFPFNSYFLTQKSIPSGIKNLIKVYYRITKIFGIDKEKNIGLKY